MGLDINSNFTEVENCGSCGKNSLLIIHDFGNSPLAGYFPHKGKVSYDYLIPMQLLYCKTCFLTQISPNVSDDLLFKNYRYVSAIGMKQHFANFANWFQKFLKIDTKSEILEIGIERIKKLKLESKIDLRHDAKDIENAGAEILQDFGVNFFAKDEVNKIKILHEFLENEILIDKIYKFLLLKTNNNEIIKRLLVVNKNPFFIDKFIISNHKNVSQVLMVLFLLKITKNFQIKNYLL